MKNQLLLLILSLFVLTGSSQSFRFEHTGGRAAIVKKETLKTASLVSEVIPAYPTARYERFFTYASVEISAVCKGKPRVSTNSSDLLTAEQKDILVSADPGTDIRIKINSNYKNAGADNACHDGKIREAEYVITPGPEVEANYPGGQQEMYNYLTVNFIKKAMGIGPYVEAPHLSVAFSINEEGQIVDLKIHLSSSDPEIDKLVLDAFLKMPKWKPAENSKGQKISQKFILDIGAGGC